MRLRIFAFITWAVVRLTFRDRVAAFFILVLPFAIMTLIGTVLAPDTGRPVGIVLADHGPWAQRLVDELSHDQVIKVQRYATLAELDTAVREERVTAGLEVPADFDAALNGHGTANPEFVVEREELVPAAVRLAVERDLTAVTATGLAAHYDITVGKVSPGTALLRATSAASTATPPVDIDQVTQPTAAALTGIAYTAPGTLVFFMFVNIVSTSSGLVLIRRSGVPRRMLSTATGPWLLTLSEAAGRVLLGMIQAVVVIGVGALAFHVNWGPLGLALAVALLAAVISAALALITSTVATSPQQAMVIAPAIMITTAMLGGCLWPLATEGGTLRLIGRFFPQGWAMDALLRLGVPGGGVREVVTDIGVLLAFAVALTLIAMPAYRRKIAVSQ
jgi:ABC-2 type transport system permease protein